MIAPANITIDVSGLPAAVQAVIATIDAQIGTWTPFLKSKSVSIDLSGIAGPLAAKQQGLDRIINGYRKLGWILDYDFQQTTETVRVLVFRLPD